MKIMKNSSKNIEKAILYIISWVCTTLISIMLYGFFTRFLEVNYYLSNIISWTGAVMFAFVANRKIVFRSFRDSNVTKQLIAFLVMRLISLAVEHIILFIFVSTFLFNDMVVKIFAQGVIIIVNYILSKKVVFKEKE